MRAIGKEKSISYRKRFVGKELDSLVLSSLEDGKSVVLSGNYIRMVVDEELKPGEVVGVRLKEVGEKREENYGEVISRAVLCNEGAGTGKRA